ncbi:MAG TPA: hypothetical protein VLN48_09910 [Bryobacteraceae bacterium]|nr:hypothetical protein [Bryobacteraceae bacterium]
MMHKLAALAVLFAAPGWPQSACDRACLENFVDQYMDALIAHNPKALPMTARVKNTEDGVQLDPDDGFWRSANAKGSYRFFVTDTENGQVAFMGTMREDPNLPVIIGIRLKVENRQISEIENLVVRDALAATNLEKIGKPNAVFLEAIPAAQRAPRAELVRVANLYLSALEKNDGKVQVPFAPGCERVQNGVQTTNNPNAIAQMTPPPAPGRGQQAPAPVKPQPPPPVNITELGCAEQFRLGVFGWVRRVRDRRFVAVDRERGLVLAIVSIDEPAGKYATYKLSDGRTMTYGPNRPTTIAAFEAYKIEGGKLRRIEAVQHDIPYGMLSGWSSYEEGMSSRARTQ